LRKPCGPCAQQLLSEKTTLGTPAALTEARPIDRAPPHCCTRLPALKIITAFYYTPFYLAPPPLLWPAPSNLPGALLAARDLERPSQARLHASVTVLPCFGYCTVVDCTTMVPIADSGSHVLAIEPRITQKNLQVCPLSCL
jgi:hypothetical protein